MEKASDHILKVLLNYMRRENLQVNKEDFRMQLFSNPSFPSVKSMTDTLDYFNIPNVAVSVDKSLLHKLPSFFIAVMRGLQGSPIVQVFRTPKGINILKSGGIKETITDETFSEAWDGTVIAIENPNRSKKTIGFSLWHPLVPIVIISLATIIANITVYSGMGFMMSILASLGLWFSYFIVQEELGVFNELTAKICNSAAANTSCTDVVTSDSAKTINAISLSDITIVFFLSILSVLLLIGFNNTFFFMMGVCSVPVILYSIYSQAYVLKKWCPVCLAIGGTVLLMATLSILGGPHLTTNYPYLLKAMAIFFTVSLLWYYIKRFIKSAQELQEVKTQHMSFKRNEHVLSSLLKKESIPHPNIKKRFLVFGNPEAAVTITGVTNPTCGYCKDAFLAYHNASQQLKDKFKLQIIFSVSLQNEDSIGYNIAGHVTETYRENPEAAYATLLKWYNDRDPEKWTHIKPDQPEYTREILTEHKEWCRAQDIFGTPTTLVDKFLFPLEYETKDIGLFIDYLHEYSEAIMPYAPHVKEG